MVYEGDPTPPGRLRNPRTRFRPVSGTKAPRAGRARPGPTASPRIPKPRPPHSAYRRAAPSQNNGGHKVARTAQNLGTYTVARDPSDPRPYNTALVLAPPQPHTYQAAALFFPTQGASLEAQLGPSATPLGHHPKADGLTQTTATRHHALLRRGTIISFDSGAAVAVVRLGDTPDSPVTAVPLVNGVDPATVAAGKTAVLISGSVTDLTDGAITGVQ
ncbi:MAG TPA: hypothetical protein VFA70_13310 [Dehalococcoidia bacterium]|nr:hypothetical protein [Dehalococcoidia bacterium]